LFNADTDQLADFEETAPIDRPRGLAPQLQTIMLLLKQFLQSGPPFGAGRIMGGQAGLQGGAVMLKLLHAKTGDAFGGQRPGLAVYFQMQPAQLIVPQTDVPLLQCLLRGFAQKWGQYLSTGALR